MVGIFFTALMAILLLTLGLVFSILSYSQKKPTFFYLGVTFVAILALLTIKDLENYIFYIKFGNNAAIIMTGIWVVSIIFLIISKTKPEKVNDQITDAFLDDVINADDEEWDPES